MRRIAGKGYGPKRRRYNLPPPNRATRMDWAEAMILPGCQGGNSASLVTYEEHERRQHEGACYEAVGLGEERQTRTDLWNTERVLTTMPRRNASANKNDQKCFGEI